MYESEKRMGTVFGIFTAFIFVACLGLFGLSVYTADRRKKEIGVRKVLGASVQNVFVSYPKNSSDWFSLLPSLPFPWPGGPWITGFRISRIG